MTEKFIMAGDTALHICDSETDGPAVVLLHGYLENMIVWEEFVPLLYKRVRVITLDIPGHGISEVKGEVHTMEYLADTLSAALVAIGVNHCFVVGHSMGGYIALSFCERFPQMTDGVILLSSTPNADSEEKIKNREREISLVCSGKKEMLARVAPAAGFADDNNMRMRSHIDDLTEIVYMTEDDGIVALLRGMIKRKDMNDMLRCCGKPQLFILGCKDNYISNDVADKMVADHPQAEVVRLANSGHMGFMEEPERCADAILDFVFRHSGQKVRA